jgi:hypothetical protein
MKRILSFITVFALLLTACTGPQGPPGFDGFDGVDGADGVDGSIFEASAFEIELDFTQDNEFSFTEPYGPDFDLLPTDITLVYILWETLDDGTEVWRALPQNVVFDDSILIYNFDFTQTDVRFFLDGTSDFTLLDDSFTLGQTFRVVVIPAVNLGRVDLSNLETVMNLYGITEFEKR